MSLRTLACIAFGATIGLLVAAWQPRPVQETGAVDRTPIVESPSPLPPCCSEAGTSRAARLTPGRSSVSVVEDFGDR